MGDNREYEVWGVFLGVLSIVSGELPQTFEGSSLVNIGYHWLALEIIYLIADLKLKIGTRKGAFC